MVNLKQSYRMLCVELLTGFLFLMPPSCDRKSAQTPADSIGYQTDTFSVAFYNVENLFDNELDGNEYLEYRPDAFNWNREMQNRKYGNIASAIAAINASIIALCEVEDRDALRLLRDKLREMGREYRFSSIIDTPRTTNTFPALLSLFPIRRCLAHPVSFSDRTESRPILEAQIDVYGTTFTLFINHWPSKRRPESFRLHAAGILLECISRLPSGADYCILGDLNSDYDEFSTFTTFGLNDTHDSTGVNHCLGTIRFIGPCQARLRTECEVITTSFPSHYDLWNELEEKKRMSYFYRGNRQTPDHIILPPSLYDSTGISYVDNSFDVFTWEGRLLSEGKPFRWKIIYRGNRKIHAGYGYSDHLPIVAKFVREPSDFAAWSRCADHVDVCDTAGGRGWFEFNSSGWVACDNHVVLERDTVRAAAGRWAMSLKARAKGDNKTVATTVVRSCDRRDDGSIRFLLCGKGTLNFRTREAGSGKWRYHRPDTNSYSARATYVTIDFNRWREIVLCPAVPKELPVELELRIGKWSELDVRIDM